MRGKVNAKSVPTAGPGITHAYAGKSTKDRGQDPGHRDHPRVCGEKLTVLPCLPLKSGSPPRMRGKARLLWRQPLQSRDHPRVCGEKSTRMIFPMVWTGSPPRMRGKANPDALLTPNARITPAYAGKRLKRSRSTVSHVAIVPLFPSVCNKPVVSDGSPAGRDAPLFLPAENAVPASPAYNLRSL